jgi:hypothetical protein
MDQTVGRRTDLSFAENDHRALAVLLFHGQCSHVHTRQKNTRVIAALLLPFTKLVAVVVAVAVAVVVYYSNETENERIFLALVAD